MSHYSLFVPLIVVLVSGGIFFGCEENVDTITLALDAGGAPGDAVEELKPEDNPFHAIIYLSKATAGDIVQIDLVAIGTHQESEDTILSKTYQVKEDNHVVDVQIRLPRPWPVGQYRIDAYLNDTFLMRKDVVVGE